MWPKTDTDGNIRKRIEQEEEEEGDGWEDA